MQVDLSKRYGCLVGGVNDIKTHPWFRPLDFAALKQRTLQPPIRWAATASCWRELSRQQPCCQAAACMGCPERMVTHFQSHWPPPCPHQHLQAYCEGCGRLQQL
jgi:hypothetical protein